MTEETKNTVFDEVLNLRNPTDFNKTAQMLKMKYMLYLSNTRFCVI